MEQITKAWYAFWVWLAYFLGLRRAWCYLVRCVLHENQRMAIPTFKTPAELEVYFNARFKYRKDPLNGVLDYVSHEEQFQAWLVEPLNADGDCDDAHWWLANALLKIQGVEIVYFMSCVYHGGGHSTTVYRYQGEWYHFNYTIRHIQDPNQAPTLVAKEHSKDHSSAVMIHVWETVKPWRLYGINPIIPR